MRSQLKVLRRTSDKVKGNEVVDCATVVMVVLV